MFGIDYSINFDVPRFENGLGHKDYADLVQSYKLRKFMERELWKMDTDVSPFPPFFMYYVELVTKASL